MGAGFGLEEDDVDVDEGCSLDSEEFSCSGCCSLDLSLVGGGVVVCSWEGLAGGLFGNDFGEGGLCLGDGFLDDSGDDDCF